MPNYPFGGSHDIGLTKPLFDWLSVAHNPDGTDKLGGGGSGVSDQHTLNGGVSSGVSSITVDRNPTAIFPGGSFVAIGTTLNTCEIRRVTAVAGAVLTLASSLVYAHSNAENVWVLDSTWVPFDWFGCKANDATFDSFIGLQQAFNDCALQNGVGYGLTGYNSRYYTSTPICFFDNTPIQQAIFVNKSPFSINPMQGVSDGVPSQFLAMLGGQFGTVTGVNAGTDTVTLSTSAGGVGDTVTFYPAIGSTLPGGIEAGRMYFTITNPSGNNYTISKDYGGSTLDITSTGSGTIYFYSVGMARLRMYDVRFSGGVQALNGLLAFVQQPSQAIKLRIDNFFGPKGGLVLAGQQGGFEGLEITNCFKGLALRGMEFMYAKDINVESCDITIEAKGGTGGGPFGENESSTRDIKLFGTHLEDVGNFTQQVQTVVGNASVSAGNFTLTYSGQTTGNIAFNANAAAVQTALEALSNIDPGDITVTDLGGGLPNGRCQIDFRVNNGTGAAGSGQWAWKGLVKMTVNSAGLTGGTYTTSGVFPVALGAAGVSLLGNIETFYLGGGVWSAGIPDPSGTIIDMLVNQASGSVADGYCIENFSSIGTSGNAVNDIPRGITCAWADGAHGSNVNSQRVGMFRADGYHGNQAAKTWWLVQNQSSAGSVVWDSYDGEFRINGKALVRFGDTGPIFQAASGDPNGSAVGPVGSLYLRTNGGANTTLYVKESGTGATGWVAK